MLIPAMEVIVNKNKFNLRKHILECFDILIEYCKKAKLTPTIKKAR